LQFWFLEGLNARLQTGHNSSWVLEEEVDEGGDEIESVEDKDVIEAEAGET